MTGMYPTITVLFCLYIGMLPSNSSILVSQFPPMVETTFNVTAYIGLGKRLFEIVQEPSTWYESFYKCKERGYGKLLNFNPKYARVQSMSQIFREDDSFSTTNTSFWVGWFRPYLILDRWYRAYGDVTSPYCNEFSSDIVGSHTGTGNIEQCAYVSFTGVMYKPVLVADDCSTSLPYICDMEDGEVEYLLYDGFEINMDGDLLHKSGWNVTDLLNCSNACSDFIRCAGFSFYNVSNECVLFILNQYYYRHTYSISRVVDFVTHGVKNSSHFRFTNNQVNLTKPETDLIFPACIPSGYCLLANTTRSPNTTQSPLNITEIEEMTEEILRNITIDPDSTSKSRQRYESATDNSSTSRAFGAFAVAMIVIVCSLPVIMDFISFIGYLETLQFKRKQQQRCERRQRHTVTSNVNEESV